MLQPLFIVRMKMSSFVTRGKLLFSIHFDFESLVRAVGKVVLSVKFIS